MYLKYIVHMRVRKAEIYCHVAYDITSTIRTVMVENENKIENRIVSLNHLPKAFHKTELLNLTEKTNKQTNMCYKIICIGISTKDQ